jgi:hypothetical protein
MTTMDKLKAVANSSAGAEVDIGPMIVSGATAPGFSFLMSSPWTRPERGGRR